MNYHESQKKHCPSFCSHLRSDPDGGRAGRFADFQMQNMRNFKARKGGLLLLAAVLVCLFPRFGYTAGSTVETASAPTTTVISSEQIEQTGQSDQLGTG